MKTIILLIFLSLTHRLYSQNYPWERPLNMAWSADGTTFNTPSTFQDSSGVPSITRWKGDTLIATFQWFRLPLGSLSWDRVAVKFSYDNGTNWTQPTPIIMNGLPANYQRPFDPTLVVINSDSIRMYYSSSDGIPVGGLDSTVNTYSAVSNDGIHYSFETNARVDELNNRVIDPAVLYFKNAYHYASPIGSPQQGAYHYVSPDGINFTKVANIPSDMNHNWTGNYMMKDTNELRFYGAGNMGIWYNSSPNGGIWNGYTITNIQGGDPSVLKISASNYLMVYVGPPYATGLHNTVSTDKNISIYPNPASESINLLVPSNRIGENYTIYDIMGKPLVSGCIHSESSAIKLHQMSSGSYWLHIGDHSKQAFQVIKE
jgi:hypothetical protein